MRWLCMGAVLVLASCDFVFRLAGDGDALVIAPGRWTEVATGLGHTYAIDTDAQLWCWGPGRVGAARR